MNIKKETERRINKIIENLLDCERILTIDTDLSKDAKCFIHNEIDRLEKNLGYYNSIMEVLSNE